MNFKYKKFLIPARSAFVVNSIANEGEFEAWKMSLCYESTKSK
jgi:hypothetical protein